MALAAPATSWHNHWTIKDFIIDSMDNDGVLSSSLVCIKNCVPIEYRKDVPGIIEMMVENGTLVRVKKDTYKKVVTP